MTNGTTLTPEQYAVFQQMLKEKEQRDSMIIISGKGNLTVKGNAYGSRGRVFMQPIRDTQGRTFVRTGGNIPASFSIDGNRLMVSFATSPLATKDIDFWHNQFTNRPGPVNLGQPVTTPQYTPQANVQPVVSAPIQSVAPISSESEANPSDDTIRKAKKYVDAGAYADMETAIREVLKSKRK